MEKQQPHPFEVTLHRGATTRMLPNNDNFTGINGMPKSRLVAMKISTNQTDIGLAFYSLAM